MVVPVCDAAAFGAALATRGTADTVRPSADEIEIRRRAKGVQSLVIVDDAPGVVDLECSWNELRRAVETDPHVSTVSAVSLRFSTDSVPRLPPDKRATLSSLLRRIALFSEPNALDWLFIWHEWVMRERSGVMPRLPDSLITDLTDENFGLHPIQLQALGIDRPRWSRATSEKRGSKSGDESSTTHNGRRDPSTAGAPATPASEASDEAAVSAGETRPYQEARLRESGRRYNHLAITVLRLDPEYPIKREFYSLGFPRRWKESLRLLATASRDGGEFPARIPIASLNDAISAVVPDCIVTRPYATDDASEDWLLAYNPVNPEAIFRLVTAWVRAQKAAPEQIQSTLSQLSPNDLNWSSVSISPDLPFSQLTRLIPMEVAAKLSRPDAQMPFGNLRFVHCPTKNGAELMSWPPERIEDGEPFSVTIGISAQTMPFSSELLIYLSFGVRRWMPSRGRLTLGQRYPAYFEPTRSSLSGSTPRHLGTAKIELARLPLEGGRNAWLPQWHRGLARVLDQAGYLNQIPDPRQLIAEPSQLLRSPDPTALVYSKRMLPWPKVSEGLPVVDRAELMSWVVGELTPSLRPAGPLRREKSTIYRGLTVAAKSVIAPDALRTAIGPRLTVELFTESESTAQHALDRLAARLGLELPQANELSEAEVLVDLGVVSVGVRRMAFPSIDFAGDRRRRQAAVEAQIDLITGPPGQATNPTIALMEVSNPDRDIGRNHNAGFKAMLHRRLASTGRLSQFVTTEFHAQSSSGLSDDRELSRTRISAAVDDLFRQLGVRPVALPLPVSKTLTYRPALLAIWILRPNGRSGTSFQGQVPVALLSDPTGQQVLVRTPEMGWKPLHSGLLEIGQDNGAADQRYGTNNITRFIDDTTRFIKDVVEDAVANHPNTLLLTHAQNLRTVWGFLTNSHLYMDTMGSDVASRRPIATMPGLRHVRVRTADYGETPECYGINGDGVGQPTGLWRHLEEPRLFASTAGKPATHVNASVSVSKLSPGERNGKSIRMNTKAQVWNEQVVELLVAGLQDGDRPEHWAALAHNLRNAEPYSHWMTTLPWPLSLATQIEKYISWEDPGISPIRQRGG
ncbi:pPIWI_RE module domain-containing protein [Acrocarpospora pleiomorpha]|nr:DUF3962 domain-containing protein [Acrocarpospora pleiomorpha]